MTSDASPDALSRDLLYNILRGVAALTDHAVVADLARLVGHGAPADIGVAFNHKQIASKRWLVDSVAANLPADLGCVWVLGAWYGVLGALLLDDRRLSIQRVVSLDLDASCAEVASQLNRRHVAQGRFRAVTADMMQLTFPSEGPDAPGLIVNTSCEHLADVPGWVASLPRGTWLALQSNDYVAIPEHLSSVATLADFEAQVGLSEVIYAGSLPTKNYTRFMIIGRR